MHLFLIRHGQTNHNHDRRYQGWVDAPLNETGTSQAKSIAKRLSDKKIDATYASDLQRSIQTAEVIAKKHGLKINIDKRLREISFGDWEGMSYTEIQAMSPTLLETWMKNPADVSPPNGETLTQLALRVKAVIDEIKTEYKDKTVLFVTHGGVIRTLFCTVLDVNLNNHLQFDCATGSLSIISFYDEYKNLRLLNDISHLQT